MDNTSSGAVAGRRSELPHEKKLQQRGETTLMRQQLEEDHPKPWSVIEHTDAPERFLCVHDATGAPVPQEVLWAHYERLRRALQSIAVHDTHPTISPPDVDMTPPGWSQGMIRTAQRALGETGEERWAHRA